MMTSVLVAISGSPELAPDVPADLVAAGFQVLGVCDSALLAREALSRSAGLIVCWVAKPDATLFEALAMIEAADPRPVALFTNDPDVDQLEHALRAGVHAYVINGYAPQRLRSVVHLAQARFAHERQLRDQLAEVSRRFEERKLVDRAKGILMRARQVSEDEAFRMLRAASMRGSQRMGQLSQQVIDAARYAEAINRAGQLRMLSQRAVKLYALIAAGVDAGQAQPLLELTLDRSSDNLAQLGKVLSAPTFGDLIAALQAAWQEFRVAVLSRAELARLRALDGAAEQCLQHADRLVMALEAASLGGTLHVINLAGRQRMLSQRLAKQALLGAMLEGEAAQHALRDAGTTMALFEQSLGTLRQLPLTTPEIREGLDAGSMAWGTLLAAMARMHEPDARRELAAASEALLETLELLTDRYERSMQVLIG
jgi:two-component system, response regulator PdtaR